MAGLLQPDLVLMDIHLRGAMDGIEAASVIRKLFGLPTIFLSAFNSDLSRARAELTDPAGFMSKPFSEDELASALRVSFAAIDEPPTNSQPHPAKPG
jgi:CheY-like chemotaxis protein